MSNQTHAPLAATHLAGDGCSGRSAGGKEYGDMGEGGSKDAASMLRLQERQQKVLVLQVGAVYVWGNVLLFNF